MIFQENMDDSIESLIKIALQEIAEQRRKDPNCFAIELVDAGNTVAITLSNVNEERVEIHILEKKSIAYLKFNPYSKRNTRNFGI